MSVISNNQLAGASGQGGSGFQIDRSLRFDDVSNGHLRRTPSTAGNRKTWTLSFWIKRTEIGGTQYIFNAGNTSNGDHSVMRINNDQLQMYQYGHGGDTTAWSGGNGSQLRLDAVFRDPNAWMHIVVAMDTTQATQSDRLKYYVNGVEQTDFSSTSYPVQYSNPGYWNAADMHCIGGIVQNTNPSGQSDYYLADVHMVDGQQLAAADFGKYDDNNVWQPKKFEGSYNTDGYTVSGGPYYATNTTWAHALNGSTTGRVMTYSSTSTTATFSPGISWSSQVRIYGVQYGGGYAKVNGGSNLTGFSTTPGWVDVTSQVGSSGTLTSLTVGDVSTNYFALYAIELDGTILNVSEAGVNGFYLDFSDNSSNAALGNDAAGSNNWTVNNLSASDSGVVYSAKLSTNTTINSGSLQSPFDGNTSTDVYGNHSGGGYFLLNNVSVPYTSSLEVYYPSGRPSATVALNGSNVTVNTSGAWNTIATGSGTLTSLQVSRGGDSWFFSAIRVDGTTILIDDDPAGCDSLIDTPTNYEAASGNNGGNYCTFNPISGDLSGGGVTMSNGNLKISRSGGSNRFYDSTMTFSSGKWYWEMTVGSSISSYPRIGIWNRGGTENLSNYPGQTAAGYNRGWGAVGMAYGASGDISGGLPSFTANDTLMFAMDLDNGKIWFGNNGTWYSTGTTTVTAAAIAANTATARFTDLLTESTGASWTPIVHMNSGDSWTFNPGSRPFTYTPPTGFKSLCTTNLPDPTIADGSTAFDTKLYTGTGSSFDLDYNFAPDFAWIKGRSYTSNGQLSDTIRSASGNKRFELPSGNAEDGGGPGLLSTGLNINTNAAINTNGQTYVSWAWDGGTSTVSNTDGTITSSVRANASAGFSIVTYSGASTNSRVGHGLGATPEFIIIKRRNAASSWVVYHSALTASYQLFLNSTDAQVSNGYFDNKSPTSTSFWVSDFDETNRSGNNYAAYCFAPVEGYSAFGSYTGNGSSDGPFVYTGHRSRFILIKRTDLTGDWLIYDTARDQINTATKRLYPNLSNAEADAADQALDILSNGFKLRGGGNANYNASGGTYIYAAFAEHPFNTARAR